MEKNETHFMKESSSKPEQQNLAFIDALRGLAILMVIITHVSPATPGVSGLVSNLCSYGRMGVQLFFVLSAFTLCLTFAARMNEQYALRKFYIRRYLRIAPMYYLGILFYTGLLIADRGLESVNFISAAWHFLLLHGLNMAAFNSVVPGGWSIGVEILFYLIFPFIFRQVYGSQRAILATLIVSVLISSSVYFYLVFFAKVEVNAYSLGYWNFLNQLPVFIVGFLLYLHFFNTETRVNTFFLCMIFLGATAVSLLFYMSKLIFSTVLIPLASAISFYALALLFSRYAFLANKPLQEIGKVSFSMYLIHFIVVAKVANLQLNFFKPDLQLIVNYVIVSLITYLIARLTYRYIELKGIFLAKRITQKYFVQKPAPTLSF
ncbi:MAG: acyltransferase [Gammaproteobacteria bacterium]|nr:MAG: acyltransferase [Gammaproteobacteria bacterium]